MTDNTQPDHIVDMHEMVTDTNQTSKLLQGDCLELMKDIPDGSVDMILTDPPYGMDYDPDSRTGKGRFGKIIGDKNLAWLDDFVDEAFRVLKPDSAMFIFCSWHKVDIFKQSLEHKFKVKNMLVWVKNVHGLGDLKGSFSPKHELCFYVQKGRVLNRGKRTPDVLNFAKIPSKELKHPTEKPVAMLDLMIKNSSDEGDLVFDPFMGSGSTGVACVNTNRKFIGIELDKEYFNIAKKRIERIQND